MTTCCSCLSQRAGAKKEPSSAKVSSRKQKAHVIVESDSDEAGSDSEKVSQKPASVIRSKPEAYQVLSCLCSSDRSLVKCTECLLCCNTQSKLTHVTNFDCTSLHSPGLHASTKLSNSQCCMSTHNRSDKCQYAALSFDYKKSHFVQHAGASRL